MNEDREREEQRHPHHQDVRSGGAPDRAPRGVYFPGCEHGPRGESSNPALSDKMEPGGCLMRDRVGGDTQLQAVLLLYGLDIWMEKKKFHPTYRCFQLPTCWVAWASTAPLLGRNVQWLFGELGFQ